MKIALGADHAGFPLKEHLGRLLREKGHEVEDLGTFSDDSVDYPDFAAAVGRAVAGGGAERGVLVCGTGIGVAMAANKLDGVRAANCNDLFSARVARAHNDANVLALGARVVGSGLAEEIVRTFLETEWEGGRHRRRVDKIRELERAP
ncbi:MAG TPA: ribose 5-phosphate isomerase B [Thermoanaerobaculia bacterium]|jgi:ribose 5-phosphate isomerase B